MTSLFSGIFDTSTSTVIAPGYFLLCLGVSFLIGLWLAGIYAYRSRHTQSFMLTLALLPAIVCVVIMMVNGNIGAAVGVAGAFSLVRFRSVAGFRIVCSPLFLVRSPRRSWAKPGFPTSPDRSDFHPQPRPGDSPYFRGPAWPGRSHRRSCGRAQFRRLGRHVHERGPGAIPRRFRLLAAVRRRGASSWGGDQGSGRPAGIGGHQ